MISFAAKAQIGIGTPTPDPSSMLDITSITKGLLMPRLTTGQRTAIVSPATGLQVYDTTTNSFWYFNGTIWVNSGASSPQDLRFLGSGNHVSQDAGIGSNGTNLGTGGNIIAIGGGALSASTTGGSNVGIGASTLRLNTVGNYNTAIGENAITANISGSANVGVGLQSLLVNTSGSNNSALGYLSLQGNTTGSNNTAVGVQAGNNITTGGGNITIGAGTAVASPTASNQLNIANNIFGTGLTGSATAPAGNIGIGTASPQSKLHVSANQATYGTSNDAQLSSGGTDISQKLLLGYNTTGDKGYIQSNHTNVAFTDLLLNPNGGNVGISNIDPKQKLDVNGVALLRGGTDATGITGTQLLFGYLGQANFQHAIKTRHDANATATTGNAIDFYVWTPTDLPAAQPTKRIMTINGVGNVGIGTASPSTMLEVAGVITATKIQGPSDSRFKKNVRPIENALEKVTKLGGYTYDWKEASEFPNQTLGKGHDMGVIAQEVEKQFPEAVSTNKDGYKAVTYTALVPVLIEAIKTQQSQIDDLKKEVAKLKK